MNTLVDPSDLAEFPGAPFDDWLIDIAVAAVRAEAGWHIAPAVTETITVDSDGGYVLQLPSLRVTAVTAVRFGAISYATGWVLNRTGSLWRSVCWPAGELEVDLTHGYAETPLDLLPVVAARVRMAASTRDPDVSQRTQTGGPFTETEQYWGVGEGNSGGGGDPTVARYALPAGVA